MYLITRYLQFFGTERMLCFIVLRLERNAMQSTPPPRRCMFLQLTGLNVFGLMQYTIAMLGYADEDKTTVLELTYNYGVTEYNKGNAYAQVFMRSFICSTF